MVNVIVFDASAWNKVRVEDFFSYVGTDVTCPKAG